MSARDDRTKREKLQAMANQTASPHEAEVAKRKLAEHDRAHPLFRPLRGNPKGTDPWERANTEPDSDDPERMTYADFRQWVRREQKARERWTSPEEHYEASKPPPGWGISFSGDDKRNAHAHARQRKNEGAEARVVWRHVFDLAHRPYTEWRVFTKRKAVG